MYIERPIGLFFLSALSEKRTIFTETPMYKIHNHRSMQKRILVQLKSSECPPDFWPKVSH